MLARRISITLAVTLLLTACATDGVGHGAISRPHFDHPDPSRSYVDDVNDCRRFAEASADRTTSAAGGAAFGGAIGATLAALNKGNAFAASAAFIGAGVGAASGYLKADRLQRDEASRCMRGKGYGRAETDEAGGSE